MTNLNFHNNQSHLLVGNHGGIKVRKAGKDAADNLLHGLAGDALQQLPLGPSLLHDAEAGADDRADVAVGQRGRGAAANAGEQHLQDPRQDGLLGRRVGDLEAAAGDGVHDGAHGLGNVGRGGPTTSSESILCSDESAAPVMGAPVSSERTTSRKGRR